MLSRYGTSVNVAEPRELLALLSILTQLTSVQDRQRMRAAEKLFDGLCAELSRDETVQCSPRFQLRFEYGQYKKSDFSRSSLVSAHKTDDRHCAPQTPDRYDESLTSAKEHCLGLRQCRDSFKMPQWSFISLQPRRLVSSFLSGRSCLCIWVKDERLIILVSRKPDFCYSGRAIPRHLSQRHQRYEPKDAGLQFWYVHGARSHRTSRVARFLADRNISWAVWHSVIFIM